MVIRVPSSRPQESVLELSEIIMETNELRMGCATPLAAAWKQAFPHSYGLRMEEVIIFRQKETQATKGFFIFVLLVSFCPRFFVFFSFYASRFAAGGLPIFLMARTIMSQPAKNGKPTVGI